MNDPTCRTCPFYEDTKNECRKNPPIAVPIPGRVEGTLSSAALFPPTRQDRWCGEHPARKDGHIVLAPPASADLSNGIVRDHA